MKEINFMKKLLLFLFLSFTCLYSREQIIRYVAPTGIGNGNGLSASNAADFLERAFWKDVQDLLASQPVTVKFAGGDYYRAYTEKALIIAQMGNTQNTLLLEGDPSNTTIFTIPDSSTSTKSHVIEINNSVNITLKNFYFTGNGSIDNVLTITSSQGYTTNNILIENCTLVDIKGVIYGATGATREGTHHITFKNCTFKRIGRNSASHMIYNAYGSHHISVINSYFEDCTGDYIRFRDKCDYGIVKGCTFIHSWDVANVKFISMPLFNDGKPSPGDESFATNYAFTDNSFNSKVTSVTAIGFYSKGYTAPGYNYLLTPAEGAILAGGNDQQKKVLLESNFGIFPEKVRMFNNTYTGLANSAVILSTMAGYGAESKGWTGSGTITGVINTSSVPFTWETKSNQPDE
jgi:hypothetical protein